jgi:3-hydroxyisobutyrate dehydrogenase-like beta-hydroxyacid dehydrogenase
MAARLLNAGYELTVYNRTRSRAEPLAQRGARVADSPRQVAEASDIVLLSLADDAAVEGAMLARDGVLAGMRAGGAIVDLSTIAPSTSRALAQRAQDAGISMIDVPVSGSTAVAEGGQLILLAGGDEVTLTRCRPVLDVLGNRLFSLGGNGMGLSMKLVINGLLGVGIQALAEAIALGRKAGIDRDRLLDVLGEMPTLSPAQKGKMENARRDEYPVAFPLPLMTKDYRLVAQLADDLDVPLPAGSAAQQVMIAAAAQGWEDDFSAVIRFVEGLAGLRTG